MAPPPLSRTAPFADGIVGPPNRPFEELLQEELLLEELLQEELLLQELLLEELLAPSGRPFADGAAPLFADGALRGRHRRAAQSPIRGAPPAGAPPGGAPPRGAPPCAVGPPIRGRRRSPIRGRRHSRTAPFADGVVRPPIRGFLTQVGRPQGAKGDLPSGIGSKIITILVIFGRHWAPGVL